MSRHIAPLAALLLIALASCSTIPERVNPEWTEAMLFKNAQEAMDGNHYDTALFYYEVFLVRYPENHAQSIAAEYEISFIAYKTGQYKDAQAGFEGIINKYEESPYAMLFHPRFRQLSEKALMSIEKKKFVNNKLFWRSREATWAKDHGTSLVDDGSGDQTNL